MKGNGEKVSARELNHVSKWLDNDDTGEAAKMFRTAIESGGLVVADVIKVCAAIDGLLQCGLDRDTLIHLIIMKGPHMKGGRGHGQPLLKESTVRDVLEAMEHMPDHLALKPREHLQKHIEAQKPPPPPGVSAEEWELILSKRGAKK